MIYWEEFRPVLESSMCYTHPKGSWQAANPYVYLLRVRYGDGVEFNYQEIIPRDDVDFSTAKSLYDFYQCRGFARLEYERRKRMAA